MKKGYETVLVVDASLTDSQIETVIKDTEEFLGKNSELINVERKGTRKLAYKIKKKTHGYYAIFNFDAEGKVILELERKLNLNEKILRFLTVCRVSKASVKN